LAGSDWVEDRHARNTIGFHIAQGKVDRLGIVMDLQQIGPQHPRVKQALALVNNTAPNRHQLFVAEGLWAHNVILQTGTRIDTFFWCPEAVYSDEVRRRSAELAARAERSYRISEKVLERLSERDKPDGLLSIAQMPTWDAEAIELGRSALVLVADAIEIPGNLGTLLRTLDACQADCMLLTNRRTRLTHPRVFRGSHGMSLTVPTLVLDDPVDAIAWLRTRSFTVYLADPEDSRNYRTCDFSGRTAIVVGNERYGISRPWYEVGFERIGIPMLGLADSLNVAISASVLIYEARAQKERW
jgi:tRNA G18 (ribose-2'-O)-methylase SpoU